MAYECSSKSQRLAVHSVARGQASNLIPRDLKKPANNQGPTSGALDCRWRMLGSLGMECFALGLRMKRVEGFLSEP